MSNSGDKNEKPVTVDASTRVPFFTMIAVTGSLLAASVAATAKLVSIDNRLENIEHKVADPWTIEKMKDWSRLLEAENRSVTGFKVPEVK